MTFDLVITTSSSFDCFQLSKYLSLLDVHRRFHIPVGDGHKVSAYNLIENDCCIVVSNIGSRRAVGVRFLKWSTLQQPRA